MALEGMVKLVFFLALFLWSGAWAGARVAASAQTAPAGLFGSLEKPASVNSHWRAIFEPRWLPVLLGELEKPSFTPEGGQLRPIDGKAWRNLARASRGMKENEVLRAVNGYFNQWPPKSDAYAWQDDEHWDLPREFIEKRGGDCEDYAIAKYFALRSLGFAVERMRIVVVRQYRADGRALKELHAVLGVRSGDSWFILDNNARPRDNIFPHTQYGGRFEPLYSFNESQAWEHWRK
jgi:predicted transglutaminase-like cysteine proteinase